MKSKRKPSLLLLPRPKCEICHIRNGMRSFPRLCTVCADGVSRVMALDTWARWRGEDVRRNEEQGEMLVEFLKKERGVAA